MSEPVKIAILVEGGIVQAVYGTDPNIKVEIVDHDRDCADPDDSWEVSYREIVAKVDAGEYPYDLISGEKLESRTT